MKEKIRKEKKKERKNKIKTECLGSTRTWSKYVEERMDKKKKLMGYYRRIDTFSIF